MQEERLHLVDTPRCDENEIENGKQPQLQVKRAVADLPEGEPAEQRCKYMQNDLVPHVVWRPPQLHHQPLRHHRELEPFRRRVVGCVLDVVGVGFAEGVECLQLGERALFLLGLVPYLYPVDGLVRVALDHLDDVLCWILVRRTGGSMPSEVVQQNLRVFARFAKVRHLSSASKE